MKDTKEEDHLINEHGGICTSCHANFGRHVGHRFPTFFAKHLCINKCDCLRARALASMPGPRLFVLLSVSCEYCLVFMTLSK